MREAVQARNGTRFDRAHFKEYGESALTFEAVYFVLSADYNLCMDITTERTTGPLRRGGPEGKLC